MYVYRLKKGTGASMINIGFYFVFCGAYLRVPVKASHASMAEHVAHFTTKMTISVTAELEERGKTVKRVSFMFGNIGH